MLGILIVRHTMFLFVWLTFEYPDSSLRLKWNILLSVGQTKSLRWTWFWKDMSAGIYAHGLASYLWFWTPTRSLYFDVGKSVTYVYPSSVRSSAYNLEIRKPAGKISELRKQTVSSPTILSLWELNACWIQLPKQLMREGQLMAKQVHTSSITHCVETAGPSMDKLIPLPNTTAPWGWDKVLSTKGLLCR